MISAYLKAAIIGLALCSPAAMAQTTATDQRTGTGTEVTDRTDREMDAGILWPGIGIATVAVVTGLSWAYLRRKDSRRNHPDNSRMGLGGTP